MNLSSADLYLDIKTHTIVPEAQEFIPQYPLWSDGLIKKRWIYLPTNSQIDTSDVNWWNFPIGTKLWKEFGYQKNGSFKRIETRLFHREDSGWKAKTFLWNEDDTEALESSGARYEKYVDLGEGVSHSIPSTNNCMVCHRDTKGTSVILGFSALQLAHEGDGLNLTKLNQAGRLSHPLPEVIKIKSSTPHGQKAMGLLYGNCAHCHNPRGFQGRLGMNLKHDINNQNPEQENVYLTAVNQDAFYEFPDSEVSRKRILPGDPQKSVLFRRVQASNHTDIYFDERMPPGALGTMTPNKELLQSLDEWIKSLVPSIL